MCSRGGACAGRVVVQRCCMCLGGAACALVRFTLGSGGAPRLECLTCAIGARVECVVVCLWVWMGESVEADGQLECHRGPMLQTASCSNQTCRRLARPAIISGRIMEGLWHVTQLVAKPMPSLITCIYTLTQTVPHCHNRQGMNASASHER